MEVIQKKIEMPMHENLRHLSSVFLDIETDGLGHRNKIVIMGLIFYPPNSPYGEVYQLFNDDGQSEKDILIKTKALFEYYNTQFIITFNGNAFDLPFINARYKHFNLNYVLSKKLHLDIYRLAQQHKAQLNLEKYTLKHVEAFLGIHRDDTISGKESIILYETYLENKSTKLKAVILLHNLDDILNMVPLCQLLDYLSTDPLMFHFPVFQVVNQLWYLTSYHFSKDDLTLTLSTHLWQKDLQFQVTRNGYAITQTLDSLEIKMSIKHFKGPQGVITAINAPLIWDIPLTSESITSYLVKHEDHVYHKRIIDNLQRLIDDVFE